MLTFALIGLAFALIGVAGLQITYLLYLDRVLKEKKQLVRSLERRNQRLNDQINDLRRKATSEKVSTEEDEVWAEVLDQ